MGDDERAVGVDVLAERVDAVIAETGFTGVVRVDRGGETVLVRAAGSAHRAARVPMTVGTRIGVASGSKALTALVALALDADGTLPLGTPARDLLGDDLPLVDDRVTVEHLLGHRSGIGDHVDEDGEIDEHVITVPLHTLADTEGYLPVLDGRPAVFAPDERFTYCNAGYVLLALLVERATGTPFVDLVETRVCAPAGMTETAYLRSDDLPAGAALGYLAADGDRTNLLHLPVRGTGDGGVFTTAADVHRMWAALRSGAIVDPAVVAEAWRPRSAVPENRMRYGLGFWLHPTGPGVMLEGYDAGASFRTVFDPATDVVHTVLGSWTDAAWPVTRLLDETVLGWSREELSG